MKGKRFSAGRKVLNRSHSLVSGAKAKMSNNQYPIHNFQITPNLELETWNLELKKKRRIAP